MKNVVSLSMALLAALPAIAQVFLTDSTHISFFSEAPMENIEAHNRSANSLMNLKTGKVVFRVPNIGFKFAKALMQEHFNENYMESEKYPKATFDGKINEALDLTQEGTYKATATGALNIHGVEKQRTLEANLTVKEGRIFLESAFEVALKDHDIRIPKVVVKNIAETVQVKVQAWYAPYVKKKGEKE